MEISGEDNLEKKLDNPLPEDTNPQAELEAILRQTQPTASRRGSGIVLPSSGGVKRQMLVPLIIGLAVILLAATIYFLIWGVQFSKGTVILYFNESGVTLDIDSQTQGAADSGFEMKLSAGEHMVRATKDGFLELSENFEIVRGETTEITLELLPIPFIEPLLAEQGLAFARLDLEGKEVSFWDEKDRRFKSVDVESGRVAELFDGYAATPTNISWSPVGPAALVQLGGVRSISNMFDHRGVSGAYVPLGERPQQGPANYNGVTTWLFDDSQNTSSGWQPVLLNESVRTNSFSIDGGSIIYLYDPADSEFSLVKAKPDGDDWTRVIVDVPELRSPKFIWGPDDRYLFIEDGAATYLADLVAGTVEVALPDRLIEMPLVFSPDGDKIAYVAQDTETGTKRLKIYDLINRAPLEPAGFDSLQIDGGQFVWTGNNIILVAFANQTFREFDINDGSERLIPFVGQDINFQILEMEYSRLGRTLLLHTTTGLFKMKI